MSSFTPAELAYLSDVHPLARLATVGADGTPHVMPIGMYSLDEASGAIDTRGEDLPTPRSGGTSRGTVGPRS